MTIQNSVLNRNSLETNNLKGEYIEQYHKDGSGYQYNLSDNFPVLFKKYDPKMHRRTGLDRSKMTFIENNTSQIKDSKTDSEESSVGSS